MQKKNLTKLNTPSWLKKQKNKNSQQVKDGMEIPNLIKAYETPVAKIFNVEILNELV